MRKILTIENSAGVTLAYLNNLESGIVHEVVNGEYTLNFIALIEPLKTEYLYDRNNLIINENDYFRPVGIEELHTEDNMLTVAVTAEHISYDLIEEERERFIEAERSAIYVMNAALQGTGFEFTGTDVTTTASIELQGTENEPLNVRNILFNIAGIWKGELEYFRKSISLKQQIGQNRGVDFRFGKNIKNVKRIVNLTENTVSYDVEVVQGSELFELGYFEIGDTVRVIDDALDIDHFVRIVELEKDILTGNNSKVVLGQPIGTILDDLTGINSYINNRIKATEEKIKEADKKIDDTALDFFEAIENGIAYTVDIISTNGLVFKNGDIVTTLIARVYKGGEDVTDELNAALFKWKRVSDDVAGDMAWNTSHFGGMKQVDVTTEDVLRRATFFCELLKE